MRKLILAAGVAALAIAAPAAAKPDKGGGGHSQVQRGGGGQKAQRSGGGRQAQVQRRGGGGQRQVQRVERRGGGERQAQRIERRGGGERRQVAVERRGSERQAQRIERRGGGERRVQQTERRGGGERRFANFQRDRNERSAQRVERRGGRDIARVENRGRNIERQQRSAFTSRDDRIRGGGRLGTDRIALVDRDRNVIRARDFDRGVVRFRDVNPDAVFVRRLGYGAGGCPPGLANKSCLPPGQARKLIGQRISAARAFAVLEPLPSPFRSLYYDNDDYYYRYGGGYLYRVDRNRDLISALIPLFGAAVIGRPLSPYSVNSYYRPSYYSAFYPNSPYDCYQYGYGYVYETDCVTGLVEDVIPTYDYGYGVGQIMPASYGYYNLPVPYRSYFADNNDYYYRYAPGAIYRVDRDTALISSVVALLTGGLTVGQPLPLGYSTYNVPLAYRTTYYDRPDAWYRYNNGYIYSVNPGTRMVTGIVEYI